MFENVRECSRMFENVRECVREWKSHVLEDVSRTFENGRATCLRMLENFPEERSESRIPIADDTKRHTMVSDYFSKEEFG